MQKNFDWELVYFKTMMLMKEQRFLSLQSLSRALAYNDFKLD